MSWQDRLRQAAYTTAEGERFEFAYEDVSRATDKRTTAFSFPGINDNYIQDNGFGARQYALRCFFWGEDCDIEATEFEAALLQFGVGKLEHPLYGTFNVVPFGRISRRDALKSNANQSIVEVTFWTTTGVVYPTSEPDPRNEVLAAIDEYKHRQAWAFAETVDVEDTPKQQTLRGTVEAFLGKADDALSGPAQQLEDADREFRAWQQTINTGISTLVGNPALLAQQVVNLLTAPARAAVGIRDRILGYVNFLALIFTSAAARPWDQTCACASPRRQVYIANDFRTSDLNAQAALAAMALSAIEAEYRTRPEALSVADALIAQCEAVAAWREQGYAALATAPYGARIEALDDGISWQQACKAVKLAAGYLVQISFTVAAERVTVLERNRTIVDLAMEFYGGVDEYLDFIIDSNNLTGAEILELPKGTEIVWYPGAA